MPSCLTAPVLDERFPLPGAVPVAPLEVTEGDRESLLTALGRVPDPRDPRGVRYPIVAMLTVVVCAMLVGARSYEHRADHDRDHGDDRVSHPARVPRIGYPT